MSLKLKNKKDILIIGPFPKPISGVSLANKVVKQALDDSEEYQTDFINTSYPVFEDAIGSFSFKKLLFFLKINFSVFKVFKNDIVYITPGQTFFGITKYTLFILLSSLLKKELIIHVHGNFLGTEYEELKGLKKKIFYFLISKFTKGIVLSDSLKNNLTPFLLKEKIFVLYNFAEDYLSIKSKEKDFNSLKITYLSNLMEEKGILYLLEALEGLEKRNISYQARIGGNIDIKLKHRITEKINNLKYTTYLGLVYKNEKKELLEWGTVFVLPTYYKMEGQPISILEALATENVIITTNHAGIPDVIKDKVHGFIVKPKDSDGILNIFKYLDENKSKIHEICKKNKVYFADNFTVKKFNKEIIRIFKVKCNI